MNIKNILDKYYITIDESFKVCNIETYPHIFVIGNTKDRYILKCVPEYQLKCKDINTLYNDLYKISDIQIPIINENGDYFIKQNNSYMFLYNYLYPAKSDISSIWWANILKKIHSLNIDINNYNSIDLSLNRILKFYKLSNGFMKLQERKQIDKYIEHLMKNAISYDYSNLIYGDPHNNNVLYNGNRNKLIDSEGMGLGPSEYDIARYFRNVLFSTKNDFTLNNEIDNFYFNYNGIINLELLKILYIYDFVLCYEWLCTVCNDENRLDINRQNIQLKMFEEAIYNNYNEKVFMKLIRR